VNTSLHTRYVSITSHHSQAHVAEIQADIQKLKDDSADLEKQENDRVRNIANFQSKLSKIRESALFLGDISIFHERALKSTINKNKELRDN